MTQESLAKEYYYECRAQGMDLPRIAEMLNMSEEELLHYIRSDSKQNEAEEARKNRSLY